MTACLHRLRWLLLCACLLVNGIVFAEDAADEPERQTYKTGFGSIRKLGFDLYNALKPKYKDLVHVQPIQVEDTDLPFVRAVQEPGDDPAKPERLVHISSGFVDLMNNVAHAKAIEKIEKGFFDKYLGSLAKESGDKALAELPKLSDKRYWSEDMMNEQLSNFNQMVGVVVAIELSHHYLGHFQKYEDRLRSADNKPVAANPLLAPQEWEDSLRRGAINALNCGLGIEGVKGLFDAIDKMPQRPPWTIYFLPADAQVKKIKKTLEKIERDFFAGKND